MDLKYIIIGMFVIVVFGVFFTFDLSSVNDGNTLMNEQTNEEGDSQLQEVEPSIVPGWMDYQLEDVSSGDKYKISDFSDKPVLLESFAVWCPTCTRQQKIIKELHEEVGDSVVSISLNTDPNEDSEIVREHIMNNNFDWRYSISPTEMTQDLIEQFGSVIVSAPSVPMILICPDGSFELLNSGIKKIDELKMEISKC